MQSSIPELLKASKCKLPELTAPYLFVQKQMVLRWRALSNNWETVVQIIIVLYASLRFTTEQSWMVVTDYTISCIFMYVQQTNVFYF